MADAPPLDAGSEPRRPWSIGRIAAVMAALAMVLFWLWIFSGAPAKQNPDRLDDEAYVADLEARCTQLRKDLRTLPQPEETPTAAARADVIDQANAMVAAFVDDLAADAPTSGGDAESMEGWITDWRIYVADREDYAERLHADPEARLLISESQLGDPVDKTIEIFAQVNGIADCATPGDIG